MAIIVTACCDKEKIITDFIDNKGKFIKGKVIIRAENDHPVGMIKLIDLYEDSGMEMPLRAVLYSFGENENVFDLKDTVYFQINEKGGYQYAFNISKGVEDSFSMLRLQERFEISKKIYINLHNGDQHREGPKHKRIHIVKPGGQRLIDTMVNPFYSNYINVYHVDYEAFIRSNFDDDDFLDESNHELLDTTIIRYSDLPATLGDSYFIQFDESVSLFGSYEDIHSLNLEHIH